MAVAFDKARYYSATVQVHHLRSRTGVCRDFLIAAHRNNSMIFQGYGLLVAQLWIHRDHIAAG